jgi:hypothetical protein
MLQCFAIKIMDVNIDGILFVEIFAELNLNFISPEVKLGLSQ